MCSVIYMAGCLLEHCEMMVAGERREAVGE